MAEKKLFDFSIIISGRAVEAENKLQLEQMINDSFNAQTEFLSFCADPQIAKFDAEQIWPETEVNKK